MGKASSAKKIAKTAEKGRSQKVRSSGGRVFPSVLAGVVVLGAILVGYSRSSARSIANVSPKVANGTTPGDHWHVAFGVYACDKFLPNIAKVNEATSTPSGPVTDPAYAVTGIHSHGDGVIHIHPFGSQGAGRNAKLGTYFRMVGVTITDSSLAMPEGLGTFKNGDSCGGKPGKLIVLVWDKATDTGDPKKFVTDFKNVRFTKDGMAITLAFVNDDADLKSLKPPTAANLAELGAADSGGVASATTVVGSAGSSSTTAAADGSSTTVAGSADSSSTTVASTTSSSA